MTKPLGLCYEELEPGAVIRHATTRTATETDNLLFTTLTMNTQPLHLDEEFSKKHSVAGTRLSVQDPARRMRLHPRRAEAARMAVT